MQLWGLERTFHGVSYLNSACLPSGGLDSNNSNLPTFPETQAVQSFSQAWGKVSKGTPGLGSPRKQMGQFLMFVLKPTSVDGVWEEGRKKTLVSMATNVSYPEKADSCWE